MTDRDYSLTILEEFITACRDTPDKVIPVGNTERDARIIFTLTTKAKIKEFIANGGLTEIIFVNDTPWRKNPNPSQPILVYAYRFRSNARPGYIAFMYIDQTDKWLIKSFHRPENSSPTLLDGLKKLGF